MHHPLLLIFVKITIFSLMLALGSNLSFEKMLSLCRKPVLLFRGLVAVVVLVPLVVILLLKLFNLPAEVMIGLVLLAASPGAPLTTKRAYKAGGRFCYSASLQLTLAILAVFVTPFTLAIFVTLFENLSQKVTILEVARQVLIVQLLPVSLGLLLQKFAPKFAENIAKPLSFIANSLFLVLVVLACILGIPLFFKLWGLPMVVITIMVIASLGMGHALGGHNDHTRPIIAISCIARNVGLALFIAILNNVQQQVIPTLVAYVILGAVLGGLYSIWNQRKLAEFPL
ncbi:bile acid:sodium symporter family protein [Cylindrospermum sp. FACHB-282]|uniref:bile acid:sodium symporter family protein n=1 Tax=Cylindrospermum sp. FACHB-282 TaxID=2692794 RepID=UPI0016891E10|nr:bile acid:sodium symporter [Cylindrospermum sp. FACHB-282]MBD2387710.1 sodium dependent transporter [Cylindrospermum sp. FACHB-282]